MLLLKRQLKSDRLSQIGRANQMSMLSIFQHLCQVSVASFRYGLDGTRPTLTRSFCVRMKRSEIKGTMATVNTMATVKETALSKCPAADQR